MFNDLRPFWNSLFSFSFKKVVHLLVFQLYSNILFSLMWHSLLVLLVSHFQANSYSKMDKSLSNKNSNNHIPNEIIFYIYQISHWNILSDFIKCANQALFENSTFMIFYRNNYIFNRILFFLMYLLFEMYECIPLGIIW